MTPQIEDHRPARFRRAAGAAILAAALLLAGGLAVAQDIRFFRIGTGTTGGTYFPIGGIIANAISNPPGSPDCDRGGSCGVPGLIAVAQASSGSVENVRSVVEGTIESGLIQADVAYWAYTGTAMYESEEPAGDLRAIARLYDELLHIVVPADSGIESVADLAGKRVSLGDEGSGTLIEMRLVLDAYGLSEDEIEPFYLRPEPSSDMMLNGELDAYAFIGGAPLLAVEDLARRMPIRLIPFTDEDAAALVEENPFLETATIPAGTYKDVAATTTLSVAALWVTSASVDARIVEGITRALWHPTTQVLLENGHPRGREIELDQAVTGVPIPLHPGAVRFYEEAGLTIPEAAPPSTGASTDGAAGAAISDPPVPRARPARRAATPGTQAGRARHRHTPGRRCRA